jgi:glycine/serine hydroxymethyltransferase
MTTRGMKESDFKTVAQLVNKGVVLAKNIKDLLGEGKKIIDF